MNVFQIIGELYCENIALKERLRLLEEELEIERREPDAAE